MQAPLPFTKPRYVLLSVGALFFLVIGAIIGSVSAVLLLSPTTRVFQEQRLHSSTYRFINPLLECDASQSIGTEYRPSRNSIESVLNKRKQKGDITTAAVYYRDLNNGPWMGINETDEFAPASLLKVPIMMTYYKAAETNPSILDTKITYSTTAQQIAQYFEPQQLLEEGKQYTVEELLEHMIRFSDNNALLLLGQLLEQQHLSVTKLLADVGIETLPGATLPDSISVKSYASLFRILFNASYLNRTYSEKSLHLLSQTDFMPGLANHIPRSLVVADKFGERTFDNGAKQLHDCGIIYYPNHPYLLCVMTQGNDFQPLADTISEISSTIYQDLHNRYE